MESIFTSLPVASRSIVDTPNATKAKGGDMQYDFQERNYILDDVKKSSEISFHGAEACY